MRIGVNVNSRMVEIELGSLDDTSRMAELVSPAVARLYAELLLKAAEAVEALEMKEEE